MSAYFLKHPDFAAYEQGKKIYDAEQRIETLNRVKTIGTKIKIKK